MVEAEQLCFGCCVSSAVVLFFMILSAFSSLEVNELGLDYSSISKTVSSEYYGAGYHFLGLGHSFIKYPKTVQQFEFSHNRNSDYSQLHSRTSDGLEVSLEISFQYRLEPDRLFELYMKFRDDYKKILMNMAIDVFTTQASNYGAYQFFVNRQEIGAQMQIALNERFSKECFSSIEFFQLRSVDLPDKFEESIQLSEVYKQNINKAEAEKQKVEVELETQKKTAEYQMSVTTNIAEGEAYGVIKSGEAKAKSFLIKQNANSKSFSALKQKLELDSDELVDYVKDKVIRDYEGDSLVVSIESKKQAKV